MRPMTTVAWALVLLCSNSDLLAQTGDGYVGVFGDADGSIHCTQASPGVPTTLYVVGKTDEAGVAGDAWSEDVVHHPPDHGWENAFSTSFNTRLRDELLDRELFTSEVEARVLLEDHRWAYNEERPHSGIGGKTPAEFMEASRASNHADQSDAPTSPRPDDLDLGRLSSTRNRLAPSSHENWYRKRGQVMPTQHQLTRRPPTKHRCGFLSKGVEPCRSE